MSQAVWYVPGAVALCLSMAFALLHPNITVKFVFALLSVSTISVLQKHTVLSIESFWRAKKHRHLAFIFETLFG
jgi:hypothetical protein